MWESIRSFLKRDPIVISVLFALLLFGVYCAVEVARVNSYQRSIDNYQTSPRVQNLLSSIDRLAVVAGRGDTSSLCLLDTKSLFNLSEIVSEDVLADISSHANSLRGENPRFASAAVFLESVRDARTASFELQKSMHNIDSTASVGARSAYCSELAEVLSQISFMKELSTTSGVAALYVGQIENLQVNLKQAQKRFNEIRRIPTQFADQHQAISNSLQSLAILLQAEPTDEAAYSRSVAEEVASIDAELMAIRTSTSDMHSIPEQLLLYSAALRTE